MPAPGFEDAKRSLGHCGAVGESLSKESDEPPVESARSSTVRFARR